ncbi:MAG: Nudix family hydrolase [Gammaproteobacteria bacterium]|nr:Nudix family hydrolase [Gammaproteobacteria bacterium]MBU1725227.1 Nudix family hydrolase [Gammaproteobacteria bacterium]MBU2005843.1 Nudix family hydrolase [Gammaproteobacteria bacterium]
MPSTAVNQSLSGLESWLHVVAAVIRGNDGKILLAQRPAHKHQGGKWEFPGGKVEAGETPPTALCRELHEELGITATHFQPLVKVRHIYPERAVLLDVWEVTGFTGEAHGREGQPVAWFETAQLSMLEFPPANYPIITAASLPAYCLITPEPEGVGQFLRELEVSLRAGIRLVQFRAKSLSAEQYISLAREVVALAHRYQAKVMLNSPPVMLDGVDGLHLTGQQLRAGNIPALQAGQWLSAACHGAEELLLAADAGVDFAFLAPVLPTQSHPGAKTLGWDVFSGLLERVNFPVYALGGLRPADWQQARISGAQGVAAIRSLWGVCR